jgi:hypothetical protein
MLALKYKLCPSGVHVTSAMLPLLLFTVENVSFQPGTATFAVDSFYPRKIFIFTAM